MSDRKVLTLTHRPRRFYVYVYHRRAPAKGSIVYQGRYRTVALVVAFWWWCTSTRNVDVRDEGAR